MAVLTSLSVAVAGSTGVAWAVFTAITSNPTNTFDSASVVLTDDDSNGAMFSLSGLAPGYTTTRCITVTYDGTAASPVRLYGTTTGTGLDPYVALTVTRGTIASPSFSSCTGFTADTAVYLDAQPAGVMYAGTLQAFPDDYAGAVRDAANTPWATGEKHTFRFQITVGDNVTGEGRNLTQQFTWEARAEARKYADEVLATPGLVSYWRLDELSGTTAADSKGSNTGTYTNSPLLGQATPLTDSGGKSVTFDGTNDFVSLGTSTTLQTPDFTVEAWFKSSASGSQQVIYRNRWYGQNVALTSSGLVEAMFNTSSNDYRITSSGSYNDGAWHHVAYVKSPTVSRLYVDAVEVASLSATQSTYYSSAGVSIGRDGDADVSYFNGSIDDVAYYDSALTQTQIQAHVDAR